jgi:small-conductance mechanosensitive channel/CRP-like cAMP-binding protein
MTKTTARWTKVLIPLILLVVIATANYYADIFFKEAEDVIWGRTVSILNNGLDFLLWVSLAWALIRVMDTIVLDRIFSRKIRKPVPKILKDLSHFVINLSVFVGILSDVFQIPVTALLATTGVISMVIGFALKDMISDFFSGIAININQPFQIGDVIELEGGTCGEVMQINWRTTIIKPLSNILSIVPNGKIGSMEIRNLSSPGKHYRVHLEFHMDFNVPTKRVLRILNAAAKSVDPGITGTNGADAHILDIDELGVKYRIRFWIPDFLKWHTTRTKLIDNVMHNLYQAGLAPVYSKYDLYMTDMPQRALDKHVDQKQLISRISLFRSLNSDEIDQLVSGLKPQSIKSDIAVVTAGDEGDSLFILVEGLLQVYVKEEPSSKEVNVGQVSAGEFFGEFSLLTGDNRSATVMTETDCVLYEIEKGKIEPILEKRPQLALLLSDFLADRKLQSVQAMQQHKVKVKQESKEELADIMLKKMSGVFTFLKKSISG